MEILLTTVLPVFGIVLLGWAVARFHVLDETAVKGISRFVFLVALPVGLFRTMAQADLPESIPWTLFLSYYPASFAAFGLAMLITGRIFGRDPVGQAITGMAASYPNTVMLGIPVVLTSLGPDAAVPLFLIISIHAAIMLTASTAVLESARSREETGSTLWTVLHHTVRGIFTTPLVIGIVGGLAFNLAGFTLPGPVDRMAEDLGGAALPTAVFLVGAAVAAYRIAGDLAEAATVIAVKLMLQPLIVFLLADRVFGLDPLWTATAVLIAAMPTGVNVYLFADRYDIGRRTAATASVLSTGASFLTVWAILALLTPVGGAG